MAKKNDENATNESIDAAAASGADFAGSALDSASAANASDETANASVADFNLDNDVKIAPVAVDGNYFGAISGGKVDLKSAQVQIEITLSENGGVLSDGETPVDGYRFTHRLFLPKPEDKNNMTASGRETKWQWKVNNMAKFFANIGVNLPTLSAIDQACKDGDLVGIDVKVELTTEEYNGELKNNLRSVALR